MQYFILRIVEKVIYSTSRWSEVNTIIIKLQFDFLHHQEEKTLKRLVKVDRLFKHVTNIGKKVITVKLWQKN